MRIKLVLRGRHLVPGVQEVLNNVSYYYYCGDFVVVLFFGFFFFFFVVTLGDFRDLSSPTRD